MREVSETELRKLQLDMLAYIDEICRKEGIEYSLAGGSLLGSIRHGGYIPWDDDIDLILARTEYEKLLSVLMKNLPEQYGLLYYKARECYLPCAKLYHTGTYFESHLDNLHKGTGVFLDLFPVDTLPSDAQKREIFKKQVQQKSFDLASSNPHGLAYASASHLKYFLGKMILWFPKHLKNKGKYKTIAQELDEFMQTYNSTEEPFAGYVCSGYKNEYFPKEIMASYEDVAFEQLIVRKIKDHNAYLKQLYGDYMQLPPENKRVNHSYYHWYWKE